MFACGCGLTCTALLGLLWAERAGVWPLRWACKIVASSGFLLAAIGAGAADTSYGRVVLLALALGFLGDVLLLPPRRLAFALGLASFLAGHLAYCVAFLREAPRWDVLLGAALALLPPAWALGRWVLPKVPGRLRAAVAAYVVVISAMVAAAAARAAGGAPWAPALGAGVVLFYLSDICVARQRFVQRDVRNALVGLPLYYAGQLLLASTTLPP